MELCVWVNAGMELVLTRGPGDGGVSGRGFLVNMERT